MPPSSRVPIAATVGRQGPRVVRRVSHGPVPSGNRLVTDPAYFGAFQQPAIVPLEWPLPATRMLHVKTATATGVSGGAGPFGTLSQLRFRRSSAEVGGFPMLESRHVNDRRKGS